MRTSKTWRVLTFFVTVSVAAWIGAPRAQSARSLALTHATVIDATGAPPQSDMTVLVTGDRIAALKKTSALRVPVDAEVVDATGKFIIPGLWDMHVHALWPDRAESFVDLFVANGITGFRDTWGSLSLAARLRLEDDQGKRVVPRFVVAGNLVDGPNPVWPSSLVVRDAAEARAAVRALAGKGVGFIKVYSRLSREAYFAIAGEAQRLGIPFAGHVPAQVRAAEAADAGQRSIEHLTGILEGCSSVEDRLLEGAKLEAEARARKDPPERIAALRVSHERRKLETQSDMACRQLFERLAAKETWQVPTLVTLRGYAFMSDETLRADPRLKYVSHDVLEFWKPAALPDEEWSLRRQLYARSTQIIALMRRARVPVLAGSDTPNPYALPGFGLHDELALLVEAGLSPIDAIQSATRDAARFLKQADLFGTIEIGKRADLVVLDASPLVDIKHTTRIHAVVLGGRLLRRGDLDARLARVAAENSKRPISDAIFETLEANGIDAAVEQYRSIRAREFDRYDLRERQLNVLGYKLLQAKRVSEAVRIFQLNVETFPESANAHGSLGEAYTAHGDRDLSIKSYERALALDPDGPIGANARQMLEKLKAR